MCDIYLDRRENGNEYWSYDGLTRAQREEIRKEAEARRIWRQNTDEASKKRPDLDGGTLTYGGPQDIY